MIYWAGAGVETGISGVRPRVSEAGAFGGLTSFGAEVLFSGLVRCSGSL